MNEIRKIWFDDRKKWIFLTFSLRVGRRNKKLSKCFRKCSTRKHRKLCHNNSRFLSRTFFTHNFTISFINFCLQPRSIGNLHSHPATLKPFPFCFSLALLFPYKKDTFSESRNSCRQAIKVSRRAQGALSRVIFTNTLSWITKGLPFSLNGYNGYTKI